MDSSSDQSSFILQVSTDTYNAGGSFNVGKMFEY